MSVVYMIHDEHGVMTVDDPGKIERSIARGWRVIAVEDLPKKPPIEDEPRRQPMKIESVTMVGETGNEFDVDVEKVKGAICSGARILSVRYAAQKGKDAVVYVPEEYQRLNIAGLSAEEARNAVLNESERLGIKVDNRCATKTLYGNILFHQELERWRNAQYGSPST